MDRHEPYSSVSKSSNTSSHRRIDAVASQHAQMRHDMGGRQAASTSYSVILTGRLSDQEATLRRRDELGRYGSSTARASNESAPEGDSKRLQYSDAPMGGTGSSEETLMDLRRRIDELQQSQQDQSRQEQELQSTIREGEMTCGRLLKQYLEYGHAFEVKMRHVREDKEKLVRVHQSNERIMQELDSIMKQAGALVGRGPC